MTIDPFIFVVLLLFVYWILDDVIGMFLYCSFLVGVLMQLSSFVVVPAGLSVVYELILSVLIFSSLAKFYWMIKKKREGIEQGKLVSIFRSEY